MWYAHTKICQNNSFKFCWYIFVCSLGMQAKFWKWFLIINPNSTTVYISLFNAMKLSLDTLIRHTLEYFLVNYTVYNAMNKLFCSRRSWSTWCLKSINSEQKDQNTMKQRKKHIPTNTRAVVPFYIHRHFNKVWCNYLHDYGSLCFTVIEFNQQETQSKTCLTNAGPIFIFASILRMTAHKVCAGDRGRRQWRTVICFHAQVWIIMILTNWSMNNYWMEISMKRWPC